MSTLTRIAKNSAGTLAVTFLVDETPTNATGSVTYAAVDAAGTSVASGTATQGATGVYSFVLAAQSSLKVLTITWSGTIAGTATSVVTYAEIVGDHFFSLAEARNADDTLADTSKYPTADLIARRLEVEWECETICDRSFVPRYLRLVLDGSGTDQLLLRHPDPVRSVGDVRVIRSVKMAPTLDGTFVSFAAAQLAALSVSEDGTLTRTSGDSFTEGLANVIVELEYGWDRPPPDLITQAKVRLRTLANVNRSGINDRTTSFTAAEGGTYRLDMPAPFKTGLPYVDAAYGRYSRRSTGSGSNARQVPASRTLTYTPQLGSMFHGRRR